MSTLTRDGTAESVSRDRILRRERGQRKNIFPVQLTTSRIGNLTWLILTLAICDDHIYIHTTYLTDHVFFFFSSSMICTPFVNHSICIIQYITASFISTAG